MPMMARAATALLLALGVALAAPLSVEAFLRGAHVTPEQGLRHLLALAERGQHRHAVAHGGSAGGAPSHDHRAPAASAPAPDPATGDAAATPTSDAGATLTTSPPTLVAGHWLGLGLLLVGALTLAARRLGRDPTAAPPYAVSPEIALPPPRSPLPA
jgi:hypothetical protein